jgi:hypothetical protein
MNKNTVRPILLKDSSALNNPNYNCNNCNNKQNVYDTPGMVTDKSDCPCNDQDNCDDVK